MEKDRQMWHLQPAIGPIENGRLVAYSQLEALLGDAFDAAFAVDSNTCLTYWNPAAEHMFNRPAEEVLGRSFADVFLSPPSRSRFRQALDERVALPLSRGRRRLELMASHPERENFPIEVKIAAAVGSLSSTSFVCYVRDLSEFETSDRLISFFARATRELGASLDYDVTLERIATLAVPSLADWCAVHLFGADHVLRMASFASSLADRDAWRDRIQRLFEDNCGQRFGPTDVIRSGDPIVVADVPNVIPGGRADEFPARFWLHELGVSSFICVPLKSRGEVIGTISLATCGRRISVETSIIAEELASRATTALENARLYLRTHQTEAQLRLITDSVPAAIFFLNPKFEISFSNRTHDRWFAPIPPSGGVKSLAEIWGEDFTQQTKDALARSLCGERVDLEATLKAGGGVARQVHVTFVPDFSAANSVDGVVGLIHDITDRKEWEAQLEAARLSADEANQAKTHFLANMSHEIRTPLGAILGFVELMMDADQTESDRAEWAQRVRNNGTHLLRLINDILNLSKVESGKLDIERQETMLAPLLQDVWFSLNTRAREKNIGFEIRLMNSVPEGLRTDATRLHQILTNIIGNAIKFTEAGEVCVQVSYKPEPRHLEFIVRDTGPGIIPEQVSRLFSPFMQANNAHTRQSGGTGLGLALARRLARHLGGDVELVSSQVNDGSVFRITVDTGQEPRSYISSEEWEKRYVAKSVLAPKGLVRIDGARVLLVDDAPDNQVLISRFLTRAGASVEVAGDGLAALEKARGQVYDVIFMDIQMPGKDGYEVTAELRADGYKRPIVALTAHALTTEREQCFRVGCDDYLTKPVDREALLETVHRHMAARDSAES